MHQPDRPSREHLPALLATVLGIALFSVMDALMKRASIAAGVYPALLCRSVIGSVVLGPIWRLRGGSWPKWTVLRLHVLRSGLVSGMAATFFWGLVRMPLAEGIALSFIAPLMALWLAALTLGERIRREAVYAALLGLGGVMVIAAGRMGDSSASATSGWAITAILGSASFYACNLVVQRRQAQLASPLDVALFQNAFVALFLLPAAPWLWSTPSASAMGDIAAAAALASVSLMLIAWAYARAETQVLVPIEYTAFLWAALMGWLWFGEKVTAATMGGVTLILGAVWLASRATPGNSPDTVPDAAWPQRSDA